MIFPRKAILSFAALALCVTSSLTSCSDDSTSSTPKADPKIRLTSSLKESHVGAVARAKGSGKVAAGQVDSVSLGKVLMMVDGMQIRVWVPDQGDSQVVDGHYETIKLDPFLI